VSLSGEYWGVPRHPIATVVQTGLQSAINTRTAALKLAINKLFGGRADDAGSLAERVSDLLQLLPRLIWCCVGARVGL
jgi:hypothetical protein